MVFANPLGLLALLGIPVVLAIHFLQRRAVEVPVATMFLIERILHEPSVGRRFDRILPSLPLFLQLLAVLLATWVLSSPSFPRDGSVARVAVVVDSSASMWPFRERAVEALEAALPRLQGAATEIEVTVLDADPSVPALFSGKSPGEITAHLRGHWQPRGTAVDPARALRIARSRVSHEGLVVFLTDTPRESLPHDAVLLAVGREIENVGFTGVTVTRNPGGYQWRATLRNYTSTAQSRTWALHTAAGASSPRGIEVPANGVVTIEGGYPQGAERVRLVMTEDAFPLDDVLPMVVPQPKQISVSGVGSEMAKELSNRLIAAMDGLEAAPEPANADLLVAGVADGALPEWGGAVAFAVNLGETDGEWRKGAVVAEAHPLVDGLNWQPLAVREVSGFAARPSDRVLLWQGDAALMLLRSEPSGERLLLNFDVAKSNAATLPAFVVMLHRFVERVREAKIAPEAVMLEAGQRIQLAHAPEAPLQIAALDAAGAVLDHPDRWVAQRVPGFLTIDQGSDRLLDAAVFFADTAEADFSHAGEATTHGEAVLAARDRHVQADPWWQLWVLILLAAVIAMWKFTPNVHPERA